MELILDCDLFKIPENPWVDRELPRYKPAVMIKYNIIYVSYESPASSYGISLW
jgi:hypothetical protein